MIPQNKQTGKGRGQGFYVKGNIYGKEKHQYLKWALEYPR